MAKNKRPDPGNTNQIVSYLHCKRCIEELPVNTSPAEHAKIAVGWTKLGLQVWCERHDQNIVHIDFEGHQHSANITALKKL